MVLRTNQYTELATGMRYWKNDESIESKGVIAFVAGGGLASQGAHQVGFAADNGRSSRKQEPRLEHT